MDFDLPISDPIGQFAIVVLVALLIQVPLERSRVPGLVGLLLAGMLIGPGGMAILPDEPVVGLLGSVGLLFVMFLAGAEVDLKLVRRYKHEVAAFGVLGFCLPFVAVLTLGLMLGLPGAGATLLAAALASHTLISYPIIKRLGLLNRRPVSAAIGGTLVTDAAALAVLVVVLERHRAGDEGFSWLWPLILLALLVVLSVGLIPRLAKYVLDADTPTFAEKGLFVLAVLLVLSTLAELIGTEEILGAFVAGICLNRVLHKRTDFRDKVLFVGRMIFIPFFFIETGMRLELAAFADPKTWYLSGALLTAVALSKSLAAWGVGHRYGYTHIERLVMIGMTIPQAAATLAVTTTALRAELLGEQVVDAIIIVILVSCLVGALTTRLSGERVERMAGNST